MDKVALGGFQETDKKPVRFLSLNLELPAIQSEEYIGGKERHSLVAIDERVIHKKGLHQSRSHFSQIRIVPRLRPIESALQQPNIPDSLGPPESIKQTLVYGERFLDA